MIPKFRGYDCYNKKMVYSIDIACDDEISEQYVPVFNYRGKLVLIDVENDDKELKLMQSTGLKDKNGVEIFEGDIINCGYLFSGSPFEELDDYEEEKGVVKFLNCVFNVKFKNDTNLFIDIIESCTHIEIIGNIYENSELLED